MPEIPKNKIYDLEERTLKFGKNITELCRNLPKNGVNYELVSQVVRSGTSIGANYIEANESLSKKDFVHRIKISRKEAKETIYWLEIILSGNSELENKINPLLKESIELKKILSAILEKSK